jgi:hypothetical protein
MLAEEDTMIPTLILVGVIFGRWWQPVLAITAIGWPALLVSTNVIEPSESAMLVGAALFGVINAGVGVLAHYACLWVYRRLRHKAPSASTG